MYKNFLNLKVMSVSLGVVHFKVYTCKLLTVKPIYQLSKYCVYTFGANV